MLRQLISMIDKNNNLEDRITLFKKIRPLLPINNGFTSKYNLSNDYIYFNDKGIADEIVVPYSVGYDIDELDNWLIG